MEMEMKEEVIMLKLKEVVWYWLIKMEEIKNKPHVSELILFWIILHVSGMREFFKEKMFWYKTVLV